MLYKDVMEHIESRLDIASLLDVVRQEIDRFKEKINGLEENEPLFYFNNFVHRLPFCYFHPTRAAHDLPSDEFDKRWEQLASKFRAKLDEKPTQADLSPLRRSQTNREFYQTIDDALREAGVYDNVVNLMKTQPSGYKKNVQLEASPAFFKLLAMDYNSYPDLTR